MNQPIKYRKKPIEVEAWLVTEENMVEVAKWCGGTVHLDTSHPGFGGKYIDAPFAYPIGVNDLVVKDENGKFGVPNVVYFEKTYEKVEEIE